MEEFVTLLAVLSMAASLVYLGVGAWEKHLLWKNLASAEQWDEDLEQMFRRVLESEYRPLRKYPWDGIRENWLINENRDDLGIIVGDTE